MEVEGCMTLVGKEPDEGGQVDYHYAMVQRWKKHHLGQIA